MMKLRSRLAIAVAVALAVPTGLAGCTADPLHNLVKDVSGGKVDIGGKTVPSDFPSAVPLYKGTIVSAAGVGDAKGKVWNVTVRIPAISALTQIQAELKAAGFTIVAAPPLTKDAGAIAASKGDLKVAVVGAADDKGFVANYSVTTITS